MVTLWADAAPHATKTVAISAYWTRAKGLKALKFFVIDIIPVLL
jgi:hypothetical protein